MARTPLLAGNWKLFGTRTEAVALANALVGALGRPPGREVLVAPTFTALEAVGDALRGSGILLGAQNVHWEAKGAFTGEISAAMLREAGATHVIIGHSERRQYFGETDATVNQRLGAALSGGLVPIVCVGESLTERDGGIALAVVRRQVAEGVKGLTAAQLGGIVLAYEPVWAIGTGRTATPAQAQEVHAAIRAHLDSLADAATSAKVRILYGGSVKPDNVDTLMAQPDIDGALVGGASLDAAQFTRIVQFQA